MNQNVVNIVQEKLSEIEKEHNVQILFAIESGSRGWGFESKDSDYDCRFVYVHKKEWYLNVFEGRDVIELPVDEVLDISGWDLKKALKLMYKSNSPLFEWLTTPVLYREKVNARKNMLEVANAYFSPISAINHYINLSRNSYRTQEGDSIKVKKLFYALRPLFSCMWIEKHQAIPPMNLKEILNDLDVNSDLLTVIDELIHYKKSCTEADEIKAPEVIVSFIEEKINYYEAYLKTIQFNRNTDLDQLNSYFLNILGEI